MDKQWDRYRKFKCVYFVKSQQLSKIGATYTPYQRFISLKIDNPDIELIGLLAREEHTDLEKELHQRFDIHNYKGEWFKESDEIHNYLKEKMNETDIFEMNNFNLMLKTNGFEKSENRKQFEADNKNKEVLKRSLPIDQSFGEETQIRIKIEVRDMLEKAKIIPRESASDCIKRIILENKSLKDSIEVCKEQVRVLEQERVKQG